MDINTARQMPSGTGVYLLAGFCWSLKEGYVCNTSGVFLGVVKNSTGQDAASVKVQFPRNGLQVVTILLETISTTPWPAR